MIPSSLFEDGTPYNYKVGELVIYKRDGRTWEGRIDQVHHGRRPTYTIIVFDHNNSMQCTEEQASGFSLFPLQQQICFNLHYGHVSKAHDALPKGSREVLHLQVVQMCHLLVYYPFAVWPHGRVQGFFSSYNIRMYLTRLVRDHKEVTERLFQNDFQSDIEWLWQTDNIMDDIESLRKAVFAVLLLHRTIYFTGFNCPKSLTLFPREVPHLMQQIDALNNQSKLERDENKLLELLNAIVYTENPFLLGVHIIMVELKKHYKHHESHTRLWERHEKLKLEAAKQQQKYDDLWSLVDGLKRDHESHTRLWERHEKLKLEAATHKQQNDDLWSLVDDLMQELETAQHASRLNILQELPTLGILQRQHRRRDLYSSGGAGGSVNNDYGNNSNSREGRGVRDEGTNCAFPVAAASSVVSATAVATPLNGDASREHQLLEMNRTLQQRVVVLQRQLHDFERTPTAFATSAEVGRDRQLQQLVDDLIETNRSLEGRIQSLEGSNQHLRSELQQSTPNHQYEHLQDENRQLQDQVRHLKGETDDLKHENRTLQQQVDNLIDDRMRRNTHSLDESSQIHELTSRSQELERQKRSLWQQSSWLDDFESYLGRL